MAKLRSINPATGKLLGEVKISTKLEIEEAVKRARTGLEKWRNLPLVKRGRILLNLADLLQEKTDKLAKMITTEMGKPLPEAKDEIGFDVSFLRFIAEEGMRVLRDEVIEPKLTKKQLLKMEKLGIENAVKYLNKEKAKVVSVLRYDPIGVVAVIKPWNFPVDIPMWAIAPALLAGNTVLFKPSEEVPLVSQELAKLIWQAGVPKEVFQILQGRKQVGSMLVDAEVDMVSFTGSVEVGKEIAEKCARRLVKYTLEMGGSSPALVLKDADLELAVKAIIWGRFTNCGQQCDSIKRVFVEEAVADEFISKLVEKTGQLRVGNPLEKEVDMGPLVSEKQLKQLMNQVTKGVIQGGRILVGGRRLYEEPYSKGWFHEPTVMVHVQPRMEIMQEEVFGPVLLVCVVEDLDQAIKYANQSRYGLTAAVFTNSKLKAERAQQEIEAGMVYINDSMVLSDKTPWCGVKDSAVGVERSKHGVWEFTHKRHIYADWSGNKTRQWWFPYA